MQTQSATLAAPVRSTTTWEIDPTHTAVEFTVRHMFTRFKGYFRTIRGSVVRDELDPTRSRIEAEVDAASVDTGLAARDTHLRSEDFFDAERHPTLRFSGKRLEPLGGERFRLVGDLTMRGVTREVAFDVTFEGEGPDPWGNVRAGATAETTLNRRDWGLNWNALIETGGLVVGDEVRVHVALEFIKKA